MGLCVVADPLTTMGSTLELGHGMSKYLLNWRQGCFNFSSSSSSDQCDGNLRISAMNFPIAAVAKVRSNRISTLPRRNMKIKKRRRIRKKTVSGDDDGSEDWAGYGYEEVFDFFAGGGDSSGPVDNNRGGGRGGGGGGGGGKGGNFGGFGGSAGEDFSSRKSFYDMAFDFVYEILSWIVLTNCLHFSYKKVLRIMASRLAARVKV